MLRDKADFRTLLWMIVSTGLFFFLWNSKEFNWWLYLLYLYFAICFSVFAHNHNHLPVWTNKIANWIHSCWITIFYGFPAFAWIPTHNQNHHRYNNREQDYTRTYMRSEKNNLLTLLIYPTLSGMAQQKAIFRYYKQQFGKNKAKFVFYSVQIASLITWVACTFYIDWQKALLYVVIPQQVSLNIVLIFNYVQHVHADEESRYNHSRNIVGWPLNFFLFNNGLHTAHHHHPGLHWSKLPAAHKKISHLIKPELKERYLIWFLIKAYIIGAFIPRFRTKSMRMERLSRTSMHPAA